MTSDETGHFTVTVEADREWDFMYCFEIQLNGQRTFFPQWQDGMPYYMVRIEL
jgi:hypothetical protein